MRHAVAIVTLVLASCGANSAIELVIGMPESSTVDEVRLYIGLGDAENTSASPELLVPPDYPRRGEPPKGMWWRRDLANPESDRQDVDPDTREVRFVFHEGTDDRMTVIVVGSNDDKVVAAALVEDAYLEPGMVRQYVVKLAPATAPFPLPARGAVTVQEWSDDKGEGRCAHYRDATHSVYVVPKQDRDCDGHVEDAKGLECRPDVFDGFKRAARDSATCVTRETLPPLSPTGSSIQASVLGGPGCVDGRGAGACEISNICVRDELAMCEAHDNPLACAADSSGVMPTLHVSCRFYYAVSGGGPVFCPGPAELRGQLPPSLTQISCSPTDVLFFTEASNTWTPRVIKKAAMTFSATAPDAGCGFRLAAVGSPEVTRATGLMNVALATKRAVALPLKIDIGQLPDCTSAPDNACTLEPAVSIDLDSAFVRCMRSEIVEPW